MDTRKRNLTISRSLMGVICACLLCALACLVPTGTAVADEGALECTYLSGSNVGMQNYTRWTTPSTSYLAATNDGYMRVQGDVVGEGIVVVAYETSDASIATVSKKGKVKACSAGTCIVYAYAQNGACTAVQVIVE